LLSRDALKLRPGENYFDPIDAPRIATIYNGLSGRGIFVPFRKGDPEGSRWIDNDQLFIGWSKESVDWLSSSPSARWQSVGLFFTSGVTWTAVANHVPVKARFQEPCVFDADSMRLTPLPDTISSLCFLALLNTDVMSYVKMKFLHHTQKWEIGTLRQLPLVIPNKPQEKHLADLATHAIETRRAIFNGQTPSNDLTAFVRDVSRSLMSGAPKYLRPNAQTLLLETAQDCLDTIQLAVNWEAERLFGVEGLGPFDEF
jgi:hypothetical protein